MTDSEMRKMQEEAVKRAEEMQSRARAVRQPEPPPRKEDFGMEQPQKPPEKGGLLETLMKDKERTLILALILLLMDEKTDNSLLLALFYLVI